jgi:hypothetical protein
MNIPVLDLSKPAVVIGELFDPDESVRELFRNRFSAQAISFSEAIAPAFARFQKFAEDGQCCVQSALVCGFVHGVLDDLVTSTKLLLSGKLSASGNLFRQSVEGICMAIMCSHQDTLSIGDRECSYWKLIEAGAQETEGHLAARQIAKNWDKLGLNREGAEQLKKNVANYHQHSHAGLLAMACRMDLGPNGLIHIGGHFDDAKVDGYEAELVQRIELAKLTVQTIDALWPSVRAIAESAQKASGKP